ncbi:hypothetical protein AAFF_G00380250 [Aldrovandia affinis]|uniref:Chemokine interleukin-8-like domain-containing protein n=1 Tax=Aldrovandia affinis TaxID=143900 RepID=A0AAD7T854_9TELE|nr:hypothetical protein AAFF_G00380250 [Aldrovandia affinis]
MEFTLKARFFLAAALCLQLHHARVGESVYVPIRCLCPETNVFVPEVLIADFSITEKGAHCESDEIIVTLKNTMKACLSPGENQGQKLIRCWNRINKDENKKMSCLRRRKRMP